MIAIYQAFGFRPRQTMTLRCDDLSTVGLAARFRECPFGADIRETSLFKVAESLFQRAPKARQWQAHFGNGCHGRAIDVDRNMQDVVR